MPTDASDVMQGFSGFQSVQLIGINPATFAEMVSL
jgi:hypothetical protein